MRFPRVPPPLPMMAPEVSAEQRERREQISKAVFEGVVAVRVLRRDRAAQAPGRGVAHLEARPLTVSCAPATAAELRHVFPWSEGAPGWAPSIQIGGMRIPVHPQHSWEGVAEDAVMVECVGVGRELIHLAPLELSAGAREVYAILRGDGLSVEQALELAPLLER